MQINLKQYKSTLHHKSVSKTYSYIFRVTGLFMNTIPVLNADLDPS